MKITLANNVGRSHTFEALEVVVRKISAQAEAEYTIFLDEDVWQSLSIEMEMESGT